MQPRDDRFCVIVLSEQLEGADLIFDCTCDLIDWCQDWRVDDWKKLVILSELFCRHLWKQGKNDDTEELLSKELKISKKELGEVVEKFVEIEESVASRRSFDESEIRAEIAQKSKPYESKDPLHWRAIANRMVEHWHSDGFIPVINNGETAGTDSAFLIPFVFSERSDELFSVSVEEHSKYQCHREWTDAFKFLSKKLDMRGVDVVLKMPMSMTDNLGEKSFMFPLVLAWWRRRDEDFHPYNQFRIFATGQYDGEQLVRVRVSEKRDKVKRDVAKSLLICPENCGEFGEISKRDSGNLRSVKDAVAHIVLPCCVSDYVRSLIAYFGKENFVWRLLRDCQNYGHFGWVKFIEAIDPGERRTRDQLIALTVLRYVCSFMNSSSGGIIIMGLQSFDLKDSRSFMFTDGSLLRFKREPFAYDLETGYWNTADCEEYFLDEVAKVANDGSPFENSDMFRLSYRLTHSNGNSVRLCDWVEVKVGEFVGRPVVTLMVKPSSMPVVLRRELKRDEVVVLGSRHVCGGSDSSDIPGVNEWSPDSLTRLWPPPRDPFVGDLIHRNERLKCDIGDGEIRRHTHLRRCLVRNLVAYSGLHSPGMYKVELTNRVNSLEERLLSTNWQVISPDKELVRRLHGEVAMALLQTHGFEDGIVPLPLTLKPSDRSNGSCWDVLYDAFCRVCRSDLLSKQRFKDEVLEGRLFLLIDVTHMSVSQLRHFECVNALRNLDSIGGRKGRFVVFGSSEWIAMEDARDILDCFKLETLVKETKERWVLDEHRV